MVARFYDLRREVSSPIFFGSVGPDLQSLLRVFDGRDASLEVGVDLEGELNMRGGDGNGSAAAAAGKGAASKAAVRAR
jgi:hypothetical protein